jgi:hypothetical protein
VRAKQAKQLREIATMRVVKYRRLKREFLAVPWPRREKFIADQWFMASMRDRAIQGA